MGFGVYHVAAESMADAVGAAEQVGTVFGIWPDPESQGLFTAVSGGHATSFYEARQVLDREVADSVRRCASSSEEGSVLRTRLKMVSDACVRILGGSYDVSTLEP